MKDKPGSKRNLLTQPFSNIMKMYLDDIGKIPVLTPIEIIELFRRLEEKKDKKARNALLKQI